MIWFNGFPFLDNKEEHSFGVPVSAVMIRDLILLPATGIKLDEVETILSHTTFGGFPVVQDRETKVLLGYIGRTELKYAIGIPYFSLMQNERNDCGESLPRRCVTLRLRIRIRRFNDGWFLLIHY
jgi:hypothetical protein